MRVLTQVLCIFIALLLPIFGGQAGLQARSPSLNWQTFEVPEFGTRVEYPARIFTAAGKAREASVSGSKVLRDVQPSPSTPLIMKPVIHRALISGSICGNPVSVTSGLRDLSLPFQRKAAA